MPLHIQLMHLENIRSQDNLMEYAKDSPIPGWKSPWLVFCCKQTSHADLLHSYASAQSQKVLRPLHDKFNFKKWPGLSFVVNMNTWSIRSPLFAFLDIVSCIAIAMVASACTTFSSALKDTSTKLISWREQKIHSLQGIGYVPVDVCYVNVIVDIHWPWQYGLLRLVVWQNFRICDTSLDSVGYRHLFLWTYCFDFASGPQVIDHFPDIVVDFRSAARLPYEHWSVANTDTRYALNI